MLNQIHLILGKMLKFDRLYISDVWTSVHFRQYLFAQTHSTSQLVNVTYNRYWKMQNELSTLFYFNIYTFYMKITRLHICSELLHLMSISIQLFSFTIYTLIISL